MDTENKDSCVQQIKTWLQKCSHKHRAGCNQPDSSIFPKRLICFENSPAVERLVSVNTLDEPPQYIALSYCWGVEENFKTEPTNLNDMEEEIPYSCLPRTLQDVFSLTRQLGFQYLWIDALCIVQDDTGTEWTSEAAKMGDVYVNATLVISAMASPSVHSGLIAEPKAFSNIEKTEFHRIMRTCRTMSQREWHGSIQTTYPLLCRAWAFQERLLARRIVHFTIMELIWECKSDRWCACGNESEESLFGKINNMSSALKECRDRPVPEKTRLMWRECVKSFSKRDLTVLDDRLFAIQGIASYLRVLEPVTYNELYFHGLWKDALPWDLLWFCDQTSALRAEKARRPSYSWSSVDCGIEWPTCKHWRPEDKFSIAISTGICAEFRFKNVFDADSSLFLAEVAPEGDAIRITSRLKQVSIIQMDLSPNVSLGVKNIGSRQHQPLPFYPDVHLGLQESSEDVSYYYIEIASVIDATMARRVGLILKRYQAGSEFLQQELYERVGLAGDISCNDEHNSQDWIFNNELRDIVII